MIPIDFQVTCSKVRSNNSSQPTVLSAQYLSTPSLDQYHTWYRGSPQWVYDPYWFSGHDSKAKVKPLFSDHCVVRSISFDPFTWSIPNLVQGLPSMSRWSLMIFRSHVQRSRSNHSFEPSMLSNLYILIPCLLALDRFCFYREDKPEFGTMGAYRFLKHFLVFFYMSCWICFTKWTKIG